MPNKGDNLKAWMLFHSFKTDVLMQACLHDEKNKQTVCIYIYIYLYRYIFAYTHLDSYTQIHVYIYICYPPLKSLPFLWVSSVQTAERFLRWKTNSVKTIIFVRMQQMVPESAVQES